MSTFGGSAPSPTAARVARRDPLMGDGPSDAAATGLEDGTIVDDIIINNIPAAKQPGNTKRSKAQPPWRLGGE